MVTVDMTDANYKEMIANNHLVIVDSWAEWCAPCRRSTPVFVEMSDKMATDDLVFAKLDTQNNQDAASTFKILSLPTFLIFKDGDLVNRWTGADIGRLRKEISAIKDL